MLLLLEKKLENPLMKKENILVQTLEHNEFIYKKMKFQNASFYVQLF